MHPLKGNPLALGPMFAAAVRTATPLLPHSLRNATPASGSRGFAHILQTPFLVQTSTQLQGRSMTGPGKASFSDLVGNTVLTSFKRHDNPTGTPTLDAVNRHIGYRSTGPFLAVGDSGWLKSNLVLNDKVIDFGTGVAIGAATAGSHVGNENVTAVDINAGVLNALCRDPALKGMNFVCADSLSGVAEPESVAYIRAKRVMPYMQSDENIKKFFEDAEKILRPNGALYTSIFHTSQSDVPHVTRRSIQDIVKMANAAKLEPHSIQIRACTGDGQPSLYQEVSRAQSATSGKELGQDDALDLKANQMALSLKSDLKQVEVAMLFKKQSPRDSLFW